MTKNDLEKELIQLRADLNMYKDHFEACFELYMRQHRDLFREFRQLINEKLPIENAVTIIQELIEDELKTIEVHVVRKE